LPGGSETAEVSPGSRPDKRCERTFVAMLDNETEQLIIRHAGRVVLHQRADVLQLD
jgi:hypothetical protein